MFNSCKSRTLGSRCKRCSSDSDYRLQSDGTAITGEVIYQNNIDSAMLNKQPKP
jgi:hypothetical protein